MGKEILAIPEENILEVIEVIEQGLKVTNVSNDVECNLKEWCREHREYLAELATNR